MNREERKKITLQFNKEIKELFKKGIKVEEISILKKLTRARIYQILGLKTKKSKKLSTGKL